MKRPIPLQVVPLFGDARWIAKAKGPANCRKQTGRRPGQPWADVRGHRSGGGTCKTCKFLTFNVGSSRVYYKCERGPITRGPGTDIRLKDPACILYSKLAKS